MDFSASQAVGFMISLVACFGIILSFGTFLSDTGDGMTKAEVKDSSFFKSNINDNVINKSAPVLSVSNIHLKVGQSVTLNDLKAYATATDSKDGNISSKIVVNGVVDTSKEGKFRVRFSVENSSGLKTSLIKNVLVEK